MNTIKKALDLFNVTLQLDGIENVITEEKRLELVKCCQSAIKQVENNVCSQNVSKPLVELKNLLAKKTIEITTKDLDSKQHHKLRSEIEVIKESLIALK